MQDARAIVASVSGPTVMFAATSFDGKIDAASKRTYSSAEFSTFTETVQRFSQELSLPLAGRAFVLSVAGAVRGDSIRVTNGRWFISISGLETLLRRRPLVLNDVSAVAWSTRSLGALDIRPLDGVKSSSNGPDRRAVIWVGDGLGAACITVSDNGRTFVMDGEGGHMTCPLDSEDEKQLLESTRLRHGHLSYERALAHLNTLAIDSLIASAEKASILQMRASLLGSFCGSIALAFGAWGGIYLAGPGILNVSDHKLSAVFRERFVAKGRFRPVLSTVPIWSIDRPDLPIIGAASFLKSQIE